MYLYVQNGLQVEHFNRKVFAIRNVGLLPLCGEGVPSAVLRSVSLSSSLSVHLVHTCACFMYELLKTLNYRSRCSSWDM